MNTGIAHTGEGRYAGGIVWGPDIDRHKAWLKD